MNYSKAFYLSFICVEWRRSCRLYSTSIDSSAKMTLRRFSSHIYVFDVKMYVVVSCQKTIKDGIYWFIWQFSAAKTTVVVSSSGRTFRVLIFSCVTLINVKPTRKLCIRTMWSLTTKMANIFLGNPTWGSARQVLTSWH